MINILCRTRLVQINSKINHLERIMKLSIILFFCFALSAVARETNAQNAKVTLNKQHVAVSEILDAIEQQTDYLFVYNKRNVNTQRTISIQVDNQPVSHVLSEMFHNTNIKYALEGEHIVLTTAVNPSKTEAGSNTPQQDGHLINGVVKDGTGETVIGANVSVKGTTIGTITDPDGKFTLDVPANAILQVSYIGYLTQFIPVGNKLVFNILLKEDMQIIDEVVVVGYGVQKKQTVTAAASTVKMSNLESLPATNLSSSLGGRVSGLLIQQSSGEAGYENPKIIIRGSSSPTSSDPLIVVDGIIGRDMNQMDPSEIASMTVLKDASAVAPYGARGANGVILITTKRGSTGKTSISYNFKGGFSNPTRLPEIASSYDHARLMNEAWRNKEIDMGNDPGLYGKYTQEELQKFRDGSDPYGYPNTNWIKETLLPRAWQQQHNFTASGGNNTVRYFLGAGYLSQDALYGDVRTNDPTSNFKRYNFRANIDANLIDKWLTLSGDIAYRREDRKTISTSTDFIFESMYRNPQTDPGRFPDGKLGKVSLGQNPIGLVTDGGWVKDQVNTINSRFVFNLDIPQVKGLNFKGVFAYDKMYVKRKEWVSPVYFYSWNKITNGYDTSTPNKEGSDLTEKFNQTEAYTMEFQANYITRIAEDHQLGALFVFSSSEGNDDEFSASRYKYMFSAINQLYAGPEKDKHNTGKASESGKLGSVFRLTYNYKEKYMVEANGRIDGSEKFPKAKRYGFFPSVSGAWRISSEPFMKPVENVLNNLKLRASWGKAGTDNIGRFQYMSAYGTGKINDDLTVNNAVFGGQSPNVVLGYSEIRFPNPNITWETSEMFNIGIDASLWGSMLTLEADYFYKITRDILRERKDMPGILGYTLPADNVGTVDNRGIDLNITHRNTIGDFNYSINANLTWAKNKVIDLLEPTGQKNNPRLRETGLPMSQMFGYESLGLFQSDEEADNAPQPQFGTAKAGDIQYKDQNGDGIINGEDKVAIGKSEFPELVYGFNVSAEYKGFDLQLFFQGAGMTDFYYNAYLAYPYKEGRGGTLFEHHIDNTWTPENNTAEFPRLYYGNNPNNQEKSSYWLKDGSYLRLKNIEIGYDFKKTLLSRVTLIQGLRMYISGSNLFTWSQIKYFDPELRNSGGMGYPQMKTYMMGVNITF